MKKIKWTENDLKNVDTPYIICPICGWLVSNYTPENKENCANCGHMHKIVHEAKRR